MRSLLSNRNWQRVLSAHQSIIRCNLFKFSDIPFSLDLKTLSSTSTAQEVASNNDQRTIAPEDDPIVAVLQKNKILSATGLLDRFGRVYATGRRKTSVARVWLKEGCGQLIVNSKTFVDYFQPEPRMEAILPFKASKTACFFDVWCTVKGGGISGTKD